MRQPKVSFVHEHEQGAVNVPVVKREINFCNEKAEGQSWYFQTSPYKNRRERKAFELQMAGIRAARNNRRLTRGRVVLRLKKPGSVFDTKLVRILTQGKNRIFYVRAFTVKATLSKIIQKALRRRKVSLA
jgi:hypothetical protein